ncbi:hypothetical protein C0992_004366 [Termitomyces sp. T32_za158]|nr:hypothetical protein C0992_004366 [Termitomyces sp. T32_za158]
MARIDPQLIFGCEVVLDTVSSSLRLLENVQIAYCRRLLGLSCRSMIAALFTETGILPLRYRRAILATKYLRYLLDLPPNHYASSALLESVALANAHHLCWAGDLIDVLRHLSLLGGITTSIRTPIHLQLPAMLDSSSVKRLEEDIKAASINGLQEVIASSTKLHLIRARQAHPRPPPISDFRAYLSIPTPAHRKALTRLIASDHSLAIERLWHADQRRPHGVPRPQRLCRLCRGGVEDEAHALIGCNALLLRDCRLLFRTRLAQVNNYLAESWPTFQPYDLLLRIIASDSCTCIFARYVFDVFQIFDAEPIFSSSP